MQTSTSLELKVGDTSDDDEARVKCSERVQNKWVDDDADGGVGSTSPILPFLDISSGDMAIVKVVKVIIVRQWSCEF